MSSYNEQIAANNARLESILERIENLSAGVSYETCTLSLPAAAGPIISAGTIMKLIYLKVDPSTGSLTPTLLTSVQFPQTLSDVLCGSAVYIEVQVNPSTIKASSGCEILASGNNQFLIKLTTTDTATVNIEKKY